MSKTYDGLAGWYDDEVQKGPAAEISRLAVDVTKRMLGPGPGLALDLGCGTGIAFDALTASNWSVVGLDLSIDQLAVASRRLQGRVVLADAKRLPFGPGSIDAVISILAHTDIGEPEMMFEEAARVLRSGGRFVHVGSHPCFVTPFFERHRGEPHLAHEGYREVGFHPTGPGFGTGIRSKVGSYHVPLGNLLTAMAAWFEIDEVTEPGDEDYPILLAVSALRRLAI